MVANNENRYASSVDEEKELEELFSSYVEKLNRGAEIHPQEILAKHPILGEKLLTCLEDYVCSDSTLEGMTVKTLGDYTLRRQIGRGGMGVVYDAWQNSLDRQVALKVLPVGIAADDRAFHRFMREAKTAARLNHENVVRVYGMGVESNTPYYAMEYVEGKTLGQILAKTPDTDEVIDGPFGRTKEGHVDYPGIATAFADMADGLHHAHSKGVIHRDIKPSNLILDGTGRLRILDFGLARLEGQEGLTLTHDIIGTPLYMSPEQARRRKIPLDHRTDIYSLGATLYQMLTNRPPFRGKDNLETLSQIIEQDPSPLRRFDPNIPKNLETIVLKCLRKNPKDRYDTAEDVAHDLRRFVQGEPVEARPLPAWVGVTRKAWKYSPRIGVITMAATMIFLMVSLLMPTKGIVNRQVLSPALGGMGMPSPDGRYVSTVNWSKGNLAIHDFTTGENRDLTDEGTWEKPNKFCDVSVWSPDSRQIAYYWIDRSSENELRIVGLDGTEPRVLTSGNSEQGLGAPWPRAWSQDGKFILAVQTIKDESQEGHEDHIVLVSVADGSVRVLKSLGEKHSRNMSLSPDGRYVVYELAEEHKSKKRDIHLLATDGRGEVQLIKHPADDWAPYWTPDGKGIVFLSDRSGNMALQLLNVVDGRPNGATTQIKEVQAQFHPMGFTQDGSFYYRAGNPTSDVYVATVDFDAGKVLSTPIKRSLRYEGTNFAPRWSPDGKYLVYASARSTQSGNVLVIRTVDTEEERDISPESLKIAPSHAWHTPRWSPDGSSILITGHVKGTRSRLTGLHLVDVQTGNFTTIMQDLMKSGDPNTKLQCPVFSKDGKQINYIRNRSIMAYNLETRQEKELYQSNNNINQLVSSPDGEQLAFLSASQADNPNVVKTIPASGGEPRVLYSLQPGEKFSLRSGISWTSDGQNVVVGKLRDTFEEFELWSIPVAGGELRKLTLGDWGRNLSIHPDGMRVAFDRSERNGGWQIWALENFLP